MRKLAINTKTWHSHHVYITSPNHCFNADFLGLPYCQTSPIRGEYGTRPWMGNFTLISALFALSARSKKLQISHHFDIQHAVVAPSI